MTKLQTCLAANIFWVEGNTVGSFFVIMSTKYKNYAIGVRCFTKGRRTEALNSFTEVQSTNFLSTSSFTDDEYDESEIQKMSQIESNDILLQKFTSIETS